MSNSMSDKGKLNYVLIITLLGAAILAGVIYLGFKWPKVTGIVVAGITLYTIVVSNFHPKTIWGKLTQKILVVPALPFIYLWQIAGPAIAIFINIAFMILYSAVPVVMLLGGWWVLFDKPSSEISVFLLLSSITTILSNHTNFIKKMLDGRIGIWRAWRRSFVQKKLVLIGESILQPGNMHFMISVEYVAFMFVVGFLDFTFGKHLFSEGIDAAIWKAFVLYVAYSTMMTRYQHTEATVDDMAKKIIGMFMLDEESEYRRS